MDQATMTPRDYITIALRRKWYFLGPAALVFTLFFTLALIWPPTYQSEATILVEQSEVPEDLVSAVFTDYLEQRLQTITRRVLVTENLQRIIERYGLYPDQRASSPMSVVIETMREAIVMTPITTEATDPTSARTAIKTIAFTLTFDYAAADMAQRVTNELVSLYLNENLRQRRERVTETTAFLQAERERAEQRFSELERQMTAFRQANYGALPDQVELSEKSATAIEAELRQLDSQLQAKREEAARLEAQLALTEPVLTTVAGSKAPSPTDQLATMRTNLATLRGRYGPTHPDVTRAAREVAALEQSLGVTAGTEQLEREREQARLDLDTLRQRYTPDHPDVLKAQRRLDSLDAAIRAAPRAAAQKANNPDYIRLQGQLIGARGEVAAGTDQRQRALEALRQHDVLMSKATAILADFDRLQRSLDEAAKLRDDLMTRETQARLGQTLEVELKGERFSLIEPPTYPIDAVSPNKLLIVAVGMVLAVGSGVGLTAVTHLLDDAVYASKDVARVIGEPPLAIVPEVVTPRDRARRWALRLLVTAVIGTLLGLLLWYVHENVIPLDVLAINIGNKFANIAQKFSGSSGGETSGPLPTPLPTPLQP